MANCEFLSPFILRWEGGFVDDPYDSGGATNKGVTIATFRYYFGEERSIKELKMLSDEQWYYIFKVGYWNKWKADLIDNQSIANMVVDWAWTSGPKTSIKQVQNLLNVAPDGIVGKMTLNAINESNPEQLFNDIKEKRKEFVRNIVKRDRSQMRFLDGWLNRIDALQYEG